MAAETPVELYGATARPLVSSTFPVVASADIDIALNTDLPTRARALLDLPESQWFDRKSIRTDARGLARHLVGLANADGGILVVGLYDGTVQDVGVLDPRRLGELQRAPIEHCQPPVRCNAYLLDVIDPATGDAAKLLVFDVPASADYHENAAGKASRRVGDSTMDLDMRLAQELRFDKGVQQYETTVVPLAQIDDLDHDLLDNYARRVEHDAPLRLLADRTSTRGKQLTVAAVLLFAKQPERLIPSASIRIVRHQGRHRQYGEAQRVVADERIDAPIPRLIQQAQGVIARHQPMRRALGDLEFEYVPLVPQDVWLEGLVNAVVHRSYSLQGDQVHVDIFDDRIEITSSGTFPHSVDLSDVENMPPLRS
jgi:ATP-dependent DNA helicase RecG